MCGTPEVLPAVAVAVLRFENKQYHRGVAGVLEQPTECESLHIVLVLPGLSKL